MLSVLRILLFPFSLVYTLVIYVRNKLFDFKVFKSTKHPGVFALTIGNLAVGGTGKSPMTEYLIRLLAAEYKVAVLSRGYGRTTKGFLYVQEESRPEEVGDEPLQIKRKFPSVLVVVCEDRNEGVRNLKEKVEVILLDDAFQHRRLLPDFSVLLFEYSSLLRTPLPLPTGNFRDLMGQSRRADCIMITKCPRSENRDERQKIEKKVRKYSEAPIFYSKIEYRDLISIKKTLLTYEKLHEYNVLLFTGIANPKPLFQFLYKYVKSLTSIYFPDHHRFLKKDYQKILNSYGKIEERKLIITTEKDFVRIDKKIFGDLPLYYIPIVIDIENSSKFDELILSGIY